MIQMCLFSLLEELLDASKTAVDIPQRTNGWTALHMSTDAGDAELVACLIKVIRVYSRTRI